MTFGVLTNINQMASGDNPIEIFAKIYTNKGNGIRESMTEEQLQRIAGRVTTGSKESHFEYLQKKRPAKKFAWVMGGDGLNLFLKNSNLQALRSLGCEDRWIRKKLQDGEHFRLGVFYQSDTCVLATWDEIFSLIDRYFSPSISTKVRRHADVLKQLSFDEIETRAQSSFLNGATYFEVDEQATDGFSTDPRFMSEERLSECEGTLEECRGFLYNRLGMSRLFDGSGFTKDANGKLIAREYLQLDVSVHEIPGFRYLDLPINITDLTSVG